jgi:hypothetical protein
MEPKVWPVVGGFQIKNVVIIASFSGMFSAVYSDKKGICFNNLDQVTRYTTLFMLF